MSESSTAYWQRLFIPWDGHTFVTWSELEEAVTGALEEDADAWKGVTCRQALDIAREAGWLNELGETVCVNLQPQKLPEEARSRRSTLAKD